jgi:hypothetical protein
VTLSEASFARLQYSINDGDIKLEVNEDGKPILTFKSDDNCRIEEIAHRLACNSEIKTRHMPILRCGIREVSINSKRRVNVYFDNFDLGDDFKKELKEELSVLFYIPTPLSIFSLNFVDLIILALLDGDCFYKFLVTQAVSKLNSILQL